MNGKCDRYNIIVVNLFIHTWGKKFSPWLQVVLLSEFDVRFNPDVYAPGIKHASSEVSEAKKRIVIAAVHPWFFIWIWASLDESNPAKETIS